MGCCPPDAAREKGAALRLCEAVDEGAVFDDSLSFRFRKRVRMASRFLMIGLF